MRRFGLALGLSVALCGCKDKALTRAEASEALEESQLATQAAELTSGTVEITSPGATAGAECENSDHPVTITLRVPYSWMFFRVFPAITLTSSFTMRNE